MAVPQGMVGTSVAGGSPVTFTANGVEFMRLTEGAQDELTVNESGADLNFRVEGPSQAYAMFYDAGEDAWQFGGNSAAADADFAVAFRAAARTINTNENAARVTITSAGTLFTTAGAGTHEFISTLDLTEPNLAIGTADITNACTLLIRDAPGEGTNNYAVFVDGGMSRFDGNGTHVFELPADATDPTGAGGAGAGRIAVKIGGATKYLAYY